MQKQKQQVSAVWTFFQKLIQHLKYRGGSFGSPEFDEGFLGFSVLAWMSFHSRWYDYIRRYEMFKEQLNMLSNVYLTFGRYQTHYTL